MTTLLGRVEAMAKVLDAYGPKDWRQLIDPETVDFNSTEECSLGQLYGSYPAGLEVLMHDLGSKVLTLSWQIDHGVELPEADRGPELGYGDLTDAWKTYLTGATS